MTGPPLRVRGNEALLDEALFGEILLDETLFDKTLFDEVLFDEALFDNLLSDKWLLEERLCDGTPMSKRHPINKLINPLERFKCLFLPGKYTKLKFVRLHHQVLNCLPAAGIKIVISLLPFNADHHQTIH
ncbi:hypothetical protein CQP30_08025 [Yersinia pestis]|uniref:Uncharacterized protein n=5 Tax=Yersinia pestis TaxID=632 RepID=A0A5P8YLA8_YERPE|nr:hypothetical protein [Yersinia pestis]EDR34470.1 conserved hypothetical protein [Yersinia pestis biovar Orientalis str. IP275]AAM87475.1 hypothetical [Yersinia pestis KIM10+]AAS60429.1 hypothetical protein YP_0151 [Yersinia pestis biovar Microtus str. 91001]ABG15282.1 conserved hypothetical protein [Yersinia pestis Antiqua]ABG20243.1 conserved hypothetical protein [Yersinia pestis Nepal516]